MSIEKSLDYKGFKPEYDCYKDGCELYDLEHGVEEVRTHRMVKVQQVSVRITKVKTFDDTGHLLHTEVTKTS